jgi:tetratricopeptide (TPR) repeat protein
MRLMDVFFSISIDKLKKIKLIFTTFELQFFRMKYLVLLCFFIPLLATAQSDFAKAEKLYQQGQIAESKIVFETILKENPYHLKTIEYLGDIEGKSKNWDSTIFYYEQLKKLKPTEANYYYKYGGALGMKAKESNKFVAMRMIGDIKSSFEKAIQLNPKHVEARWALIELYLQLPAIIGGSESKAIRYSNELLKISLVDGYLSRGHIAEYFGRYSEAEKYYKLAIEVGKSKNCYQKLSDLYKNKMKQPEKAKLVLQDFERKKG